MSERLKGRVKFFSNSKGWGFIVGEGTEKDIFVHFRAIEPGVEGFKTLEENELVEYSLVMSDRGPQAEDVVRIKE